MSGSNLSPPAENPGAHDQPLGLTVHSLPAPGDAMDAQARRTVRGRLRMLAVFAVCAAPVIASYLTYYVIRPEGRRNYGELVDPQRPIPELGAATPEGKPVALRSLKGQWLLVSVAGGACDPACERHLYLQRQLRESLGKDKDRMDWVWLVADTQPVRPALLPALQQATLLRVDGAQLAQWLAPAPGQQLADHLYLVDPLGNWMMRFPAALDTSGAPRAKRDLERLMRASASWDTPGRGP
ncbi:MAG: hypothetical protein HYX47_24165 [Burkholderiales bacterium]|nr:hypothetical protein [Burkholderiales bacterium]